LEKNIPVRWNGPDGKNIAWKVAIPGRGHASPILYENLVIINGDHDGD